MKKLAIVAFSMLLVACFVGIASSGKAYSKEKITITWWYEEVTPEHLAAMEKDLIEPFEKAYPDIEVKMTVKESLLEVLRTATVVGEGPAIIMTMGPSEANRYAAAGLILPLDKYIKEADLDKMLPPFVLACGKYKGKIYSLPKTFESMGIIYNKSLFEEKGWRTPTNREEWVRLCEAIKAEGILPVGAGCASWRPQHEHFLTVYLNHYAGPENVYKALTRQIRWDDPIFVEAIEMFKHDLLSYWPRFETYFTLRNEDWVPLIAMRKAAMSVVGSWGFQWTGNPAYWPTEDQWGWAPFPSLSEHADYPMVALGIGTTLSISKDFEHPDEVAKFITWLLTHKEGLAKLLRDFPGEWLVPVEIPDELIPLKADPVFVKHFRTQSELMAKGAYGYTTWTFLGPETWRWGYEGTEKVWLGEITPEERENKVRKKE